MNIDDLVKLILTIAVSISLVLIAFGLFKLLKNLAEGINDLRYSVKNVNEISDMTLEDYKAVRTKISSVYGGVEKSIESINIFKLVTSFLLRKGKGKSSK